MRLYCFIHLALGVAVVQSARPAFVGPHPAIRLSTSQLRININKAEDHLQEITQSWSELQAKEKEIEQHPNEVSGFCDIIMSWLLHTQPHPFFHP